MNASIDFAYDIAYTQLRSQKEDLRHARNQAGMAAAMTGLIGTVFAAMLDIESIFASSIALFLVVGIDFWISILAFSASLYFSAMVTTAQRPCTFELNPLWVCEKSETLTLEEIKRELVADCDKYFDANELVILEARNNLWWSVTLGCVQIPAWLIVVT